MSRSRGLIAGLCLLAGVTSGQAWAVGPVGDARALGAPHQSLIIEVKPLTKRQKCRALNRCRHKYTNCYNKLVAQHKNIETEKVICVKPYQKCINATFSGFEFFFQRWFVPDYIDCKQYPG